MQSVSLRISILSLTHQPFLQSSVLSSVSDMTKSKSKGRKYGADKGRYQESAQPPCAASVDLSQSVARDIVKRRDKPYKPDYKIEQERVMVRKKKSEIPVCLSLVAVSFHY